MALVTITAHEPIAAGNGFSVSCGIAGSDRFPPRLIASLESATARFMPPTTLNWALVALLLPAMKLGTDLHIEGAVCPMLLFNAQNDLQFLLRTFEPGLHHIRVTAERTAEPHRIRRYRAASGFSAGVDSFSTLGLYRPGTQSSSRLLLDCLCVFEVGAFNGEASDIEIQYRNSLKRAASTAADLSCDAIGVRTNFAEAYGVLPDFEKTHTVRNSAAAFLLEENIDYYLYSSAFPFPEIHVGPEKSMAFLDPILLPLISSGTLQFLSAGAGLSRVEKTRMVASMPEAHRSLDVCVASAAARNAIGFRNCSKCWKCDRTMITLDLLGALDRFDTVFDLGLYRREKTRKLRHLVLRAQQGSANDKEVVELARRNGWRMPLSPYVFLRGQGKKAIGVTGRKIRSLSRLAGSNARV